MILIFTPLEVSKVKHNLQSDHLYMLQTSPVDLNSSVYPHKTFTYQHWFFTIFSEHGGHQTAGEVYDRLINRRCGWFPFLTHQLKA